MEKLPDSWKTYLEGYIDMSALENTLQWVESRRQEYEVYPPAGSIFRAFELTPPEQVRAVIIGQDPYHAAGQAHGLCFSVKRGVKQPPSLQNIFKELKSEYGIEPPECGELIGWAKQGVLLLNTTLTVRESSPQSHKGRGWETLTDRIISEINTKETPVVFMLWGGNARTKKSLVTNRMHLVLECAHPSPLSAWGGFFGCNHFIKANEFLRQNGQKEIDWSRINE